VQVLIDANIYGTWFKMLIFEYFPALFLTMTVDNRGQNEEVGGEDKQLTRQNSKGEIKETDGTNLQASPLEKVKLC
jgi:hypothetical protein